MNLSYLVEIKDPETHIAIVTIKGEKPAADSLSFFLPSWSPGSYLMREYCKNIRTVSVVSGNGEPLNFTQVAKGIWDIDFKNTELKSKCSEFEIKYEIYCHELTVRTSHIDYSHAFLHGPSYLMGLKDIEIKPTIEFKFPGLWSKLHTGLKDISTERARFIYSAETYDDLVDCPVEIGCYESDGFMFDGKEHNLIWTGTQYPHTNDLKADIKTIVETVSSHFSSIPYDNYLFMTHFARNLFGGLEHKNSTALHFDGRKLNNRADYVNWLALVAHEYFHTWNVKRIRPRELGPFDYLNENYTRMHWLTEGLTSFMDEVLVLRSKLCSLEEYLGMQQKNLNRYFSTPGKKFHSLEESSFNAWVKLYRPDENSNNSSISYYLKGGLVFSTLHFDLKKIGKDINDLLTLLWKRYEDNPEVGMDSSEVFDMIESISNKEIRERFEMRVQTTEDIDFETYYKECGMDFEWFEPTDAYLGCKFKFEGERAIVSEVTLDGPAYQAGLNAGDELIAVNGLRVLKGDVESFKTMLTVGKQYKFTISRLSEINTVVILLGKTPRVLKKIHVYDEKKALSTFGLG